MKKIITAINNNLFYEQLIKNENIEVVNKDIQYKEGILEVLEKNKEIDFIIINDQLPCNINIEELIKKIKQKNENINIIYILEKENLKIREILKNYNITNIYLNNEINFNKLINIIEDNLNIQLNSNEEYIFQKNKSNINIFKKFLIKIKRYNKKEIIKNKIITIDGKNGSGKTIFTILLAKYFQDKNKKILIIDFEKNIKSILGLNKKIENNKIKYNSNIYIMEFNNYINENLEILKINFNIILIDVSNKINYIEKEKIMLNSNINLILLEPNLLGLKETIRIMDINKNILKNNLNKLFLIENKINKFSIDNNIIKTCFSEIKILGKIKYRIIYNEIINKNFNYNFINKKIKFYNINKEYKKILNKIEILNN